MDPDIRDKFWKAFQGSPFIMIKLDGANGHAEPMTAQLDKDAHHAVWFFCRRDNRIAGGGRAEGHVMTRGHEVFACIDGTLVEETDRAVRDKHWNNAVEAWLPEGKESPSIVMLRFDIADGEVWISDLGIKGAWKLMTGKPMHSEDVGAHATGAV